MVVEVVGGAVVVVVAGSVVVVVAGSVVVVVAGSVVVVVSGTRLVVDTSAVTDGVGGSVVTDGSDVDETRGLEVDDDSGRVVVDRLTDGRVGRLEPEPPQAARPSATTAAATTTPRCRVPSVARPPAEPIGRCVLIVAASCAPDSAGALVIIPIDLLVLDALIVYGGRDDVYV